MNFIKKIAFFTFIGSLSACNSIEDVKIKEEISFNIDNKKLYISEVNKEKIPFFKNVNVIFKRNIDKNINFVSIKSTCNTIFANYKVEENYIRIENIKTTKMFCKEKEDQIIESNIKHLLSKKIYLDFEKEDIILKDENQNYIKLKKYLK